MLMTSYLTCTSQKKNIKKNRKELELLRDAGELDEEQMANFSVPREIQRSMLETNEILGAGAFGEVLKGSLNEYKVTGVPAYTVAIKTVKDGGNNSDAIHEFNREAAVMALVSDHKNLVSLIGVVTRGVPLMMVTQYCEHGSLLDLLRKQADGHGPLVHRPKSVHWVGYEIALGMHHLIDLSFVHRDLAARNVLLDQDMVCKVADFGLSRGAFVTVCPGRVCMRVCMCVCVTMCA